MKPLIATGVINTGIIQDNLYAIKTHTVNFFIWKTREGIVCIDSGFNRVIICRALDELGIAPTEVTHLFLTHSDIDHVGGLGLFPNARVYLSADEEPMVRRRTARLLGVYYNRRIACPYSLLQNGDTMSAAGLHIRALASPGHTPGSMCYVVNDYVLFSGDAFRLNDGLAVPCPRYTMNVANQANSIKRLSMLSGIDLICTAHWGLSRNWNQAFAAYQHH